MEDLYEPVRRNENNRRGVRDKKAIIVIAVVVLFFVGMILSFWWYMSYWKRYANLSSELSAATAFAYKHDSATVDNGSGSYKLKKDNAYEIYQCVCVYGPGRERFSMPEGDGVEIDYGNGASMRLIQQDDRLYFCFFSAAGSRHIFYTKDISVDYLMRRYLYPANQK